MPNSRIEALTIGLRLDILTDAPLEFNYLVRIDGSADADASGAYRGPAGLASALRDAWAYKRGYPAHDISIQILFED